MRNRYTLIEDFYIKGYMYEQLQEKVYTSALLEVKLNIPLKFVSRFIIKRYQLGEVNNMEYADSVVFEKRDLLYNESERLIQFSTSDLGYGKSMGKVTYYICVIPVLDDGCIGEDIYEKSRVLCVTIPQGCDQNTD